MERPLGQHLKKPFHDLTPPEAWLKLRHLGERPGLDTDLREALVYCAGLVATQAYLRHDPACGHLLPHDPGATRCSCGLEALRAGSRRPPVAGPMPKG